ncbi:MAG: cytochrome c3 family protein [Gemmatimonadota bacterium]
MKSGRRRLLTGLAVGVAFVFANAPPLVAQVNDDVKNTKHNLSISSGGNDPTSSNALVDYGEICVYCHTPHGGQVDAPLWNRNFSTATYQMYSSATLDMPRDGQPTGISQACLSCHDGTIGLDVVINAPNSYTGIIPPTTPGTNTMPPGNTNLGNDLRNDHPISVTYDPSADLAFNSVASIKAAGVRLFTDPTGGGEKVQCASCHNPHDKTNTPFLRIANSSSNLCLTCHVK